MEHIDKIINNLKHAKQTSPKGKEYWMARDLQQILGYTSWDNFQGVIEKARMSCESAGVQSDHHFHDVIKEIEAGKGAKGQRRDCYLSRYACYLIAMNGKTDKPEIGAAQTYFAVQTRKQEMQDQLTVEERRLQLRDRVKAANKDLNSAAKQAGVQRYALFHDAGYRGLYDMGLAEIKRKKGISEKEDLLDRAGRAELAANEFRITQAEVKLIRDGVNSERDAMKTHNEVGREVRATILKLNGVTPENLPAEPSIKKLVSERKKETKQITKK